MGPCRDKLVFVEYWGQVPRVVKRMEDEVKRTVVLGRTSVDIDQMTGLMDSPKDEVANMTAFE